MSLYDLSARPLAATEPDQPAVACVPWPRDAQGREALARAGVPRLLFVEPGHDPPPMWDLDEDWVRVPASAEEVMLRVDTLRSRVGGQDPPDG
jgi:hypothetical protein